MIAIHNQKTKIDETKQQSRTKRNLPYLEYVRSRDQVMFPTWQNM